MDNINVSATPEDDPMYIRQTAQFYSGQKPTAEDFNNLYNLLITQGDFNTAWLEQVTECIGALNTAINTLNAELTEFMESISDEILTTT